MGYKNSFWFCISTRQQWATYFWNVALVFFYWFRLQKAVSCRFAVTVTAIPCYPNSLKVTNRCVLFIRKLTNDTNILVHYTLYRLSAIGMINDTATASWLLCSQITNWMQRWWCVCLVVLVKNMCIAHMKKKLKML